MKLNRTFLCLLVTALLLGLTAPAAFADHEEKISKKFNASSGLIVDLENLAGRIVVTGGGGEVEIDVAVHAESSVLAKKLKIEFEERGDRLVVRAKYPTSEHTRYRYGGDSESGISKMLGWGGSNTQTEYMGRRVKVSTSSGVMLYADFNIRLPAGVGIRIRNAVGNIEADSLDGDLDFDTGSGNVRVRASAGSLRVDTGSGDVIVDNHQGDVDADTGSGDVELTDVRGSVKADTGSGDVRLSKVEGERISADTGSGGVRLNDVRGEISADTGSGDVEGRGVHAVGVLNADTGSGEVRLEGDFGGVDGIRISTGSGDIELIGTSFPGMDLDIETSSGDIDVDVSGVDVIRKDEDTFRGTVDGGGARVVLETGSGGIRIGNN